MENNQPITKKEFREELGRFTEETLLPAVEKVVDEKLDKRISTLKLDLMNHFDDKIADLRGDIVLLLRREDRRIQLLIDKLKNKKILEDKDVQELDEVKIFVQ